MKDTTRTATVAALVVVAVAVVAGSLDTTVVPERGGAEGPVSGNGSGQGGLLPPPPETTPVAGEPLRVPFVGEILTVLAAIAAAGFVAYVVVYRREALSIVAAVAVLLALLLLLFQFLSAPETPQAMGPGEGVLFGEGGGGGEAETTRSGRPPPALVLVVGVVVAGVVLALVGTGGGDADDADGADEVDPASTAAVGRAAGRAADRLESETDVDNEVYRTWREMTELLDVDDPESTTPGEFATAAVEAGLGREDVDELTHLFEEVRYGGAAPSDDYERRAVAVFRRIEAQYADAEDGP
jgi:hypothetical protein